jgi:hypothetical protein
MVRQIDELHHQNAEPELAATGKPAMPRSKYMPVMMHRAVRTKGNLGMTSAPERA